MKKTLPKAKRAPISPKEIRKQLLATNTALRDIRHQKAITRVLGQGFEPNTINCLFQKGAVPKTMHPETLEKLRVFLQNLINKTALAETRRNKKAEQLAKQEGITKRKAYLRVLESQRPKIERMLLDKSALEQLLFVISHQGTKKHNPVKPTKVVREFGQHFKGQGGQAKDFVKLCEAVAKIPIVGVNPVIAEAYYGLPTAEETIMTGRILGVTVKGKKKKEPAWGCGMQCDVINAVLNSWKWENYHVRTENLVGCPHSVVLARVPEPGKSLWLVADPFMDGKTFLGTHENFRGSHVVSQLGQNLGKLVERLESRGSWAKGKSLASHVKHFVDYKGGK